MPLICQLQFAVQCHISAVLLSLHMLSGKEKKISWIRGSVLKNVNHSVMFCLFFSCYKLLICVTVLSLFHKNCLDVSKQRLLCVLIVLFLKFEKV